MRAIELPELLVELESRFANYRLPDSYRRIVEGLDPEEELTFEQFVAILMTLTSPKQASEQLAALGIYQGKETLYRERIAELEESLRTTREENEEQTIGLANLQIENSRLNRRIRELSEGQELTDIIRGGREEEEAITIEGQAKDAKGMASGKTVALVENLLRATQLLSQDRTDLYGQLFQMLQGARLSRRDLAKRLVLENELLCVYQHILATSFVSKAAPSPISIRPFPVESSTTTDVVMSRAPCFVIYTFIVWILGIVAALLLHEYVAHSGWLFALPTSAIY